MNSRFVNLAVRHLCGRVARLAPFSLYRINPAKLFYPTGVNASTTSTTEEGSSDPAKIRKAPLPRPAISFDRPTQEELFGWMEFMSVGPSGNAIVAVDSVGRTIFYDAELNTVRNSMPMMPMPWASTSPWDPVAMTVGDELYVMKGKFGQWPEGHFFKALVHGTDTESFVTNWRWRSLQPPPFITSPCVTDYEPETDFVAEEKASNIRAHTVVGDSQIWISTVGAGTYAFDTQSDTWSKAGEWALPFRGRAEYVPEHGLWFGFSHDHRQLCAFDMSDLSAAAAPVPLMAWDDLAWPESWVPTEARLVPLGSGRFCIARFFYEMLKYKGGFTYQLQTASFFAVLTGVEVEGHGAQGLGRMVRHKSRRYVFGSNIAKPL
jgi:hypothetical protein